MNKTNVIADKIVNELDRLGCSVNQDSNSGLMADYQSLLNQKDPDMVIVKIYDDYVSDLYDGSAVLGKLKQCKEATLTPDAPNNIWQVIYDLKA